MSRREVERQKFRQALVPGLVLSAVAHVLLLGLGDFGIPAWTEAEPDRDRQERAREWEEETLEVVTVQPRPVRAARAAGSPASGATSPARPAETAATSAPAPAVRAPSAPALAADPVDVPAVMVAVRARERDERLNASDLAALFPGRSETPKPTSRAAREASGETGNAGDRFRGVRGTQRAGPRGGGCVVRPGTAINRRFPEGITIGGG